MLIIKDCFNYELNYWVSPRENTNFIKLIKEVNTEIKRMIFSYIESDNFIVTLDAKEKSMEVNKFSFMKCNITIKNLENKTYISQINNEIETIIKNKFSLRDKKI